MSHSAKVDKRQVCDVLEEIGTLLELKGENRFRCLAYSRGARALESTTDDLATLVKEEQLTDIPGIGEALSQKITELVTTGHLKYHEELRRSFPDGLLDLLRVPGLGPRKVKILHDELHITSLGELEFACKGDRLLNVAGFGAKTQENILRGLSFLKRHQDRHLYPDALVTAEAILKQLRKVAGVGQLAVCGSLRRCAETIGDVDILTSGAGAAAVMRAFTGGPEVERVLAEGETKSSVQLRSGIQCDLRLVSAKEFPYAQMYFTGSKEHNVLLRQRAIKRGLKLNEYGLFKGEQNVPCKDEPAIYQALGLAYIPPELREGMDEVEQAESGRLPALIETGDIKGVFHAHTNASDGAATLEEIAAEARRLGYAYLGISDHSQSAAYARGLSPARIKEQQRAIDALNAASKGLRILKGAEVDILPDGSLDYPDALLATMDFVIAAVHTSFTMPESQMTARILKAMRNPYVTMLAHPTGRLLLARDPYAVNVTQVIDAARELGVVVELNANPHRFDLDWRMCRYAKEQGVTVSINPDAHSTGGLADAAFGVGIARKGGLTAGDVLNTRPLPDVLARLKKRLAE